jgi:hypothetical protein
VVRDRWYNLDYVVVGALGVLVPGFLLRRHAAAKQDRTFCLAVGRRIRIPIEDEAAAVRFAMAFWDTMRLTLVVLWVASLVILATNRRLFDGPFLTVSVVILGALVSSAVAYFIAFFRTGNLVDSDESWLDRDGNRHFVRLGTAQPYDWLIILGSGLFTATLALSVL